MQLLRKNGVPISAKFGINLDLPSLSSNSIPKPYWSTPMTLEFTTAYLLFHYYSANKKTDLRHKKREILFYWRTGVPSRVGSVGTFFFFILVAKMTPLKTKKNTIFWRKNLKNILRYFQKFSAKFS